MAVTRMDRIKMEHVGCFGDRVRVVRLRWSGHVDAEGVREDMKLEREEDAEDERVTWTQMMG